MNLTRTRALLVESREDWDPELLILTPPSPLFSFLSFVLMSDFFVRYKIYEVITVG